MTWPFAGVERLVAATGRRLLRVGVSGHDEIEFVFERFLSEQADLLLTIRFAEPPMLGEIDLAVWGSYGIGRDEVEGAPA